MQDPIVMKKDDNSFFKVSCHTKFRFAEREAQCVLGECGPLNSLQLSSCTRDCRHDPFSSCVSTLGASHLNLV